MEQFIHIILFYASPGQPHTGVHLQLPSRCLMQSVTSWLAWLPSGIYLAAALLCVGTTSEPAWRVVVTSTRFSLVAAIFNTCVVLHAAWHTTDSSAHPVPAIVMMLVAFLGWIIGDFSRRYLRGEAGQLRFIIAFLVTLAAIASVIASTNLALMIIGWAASSAALHHLLTFYRDRPAAILVAHKKFLASRLAEVCLIVASILLFRECGSLELTTIVERATSMQTLSWTLSAAAILISFGVLIKSAQLPLHGWLIQVMEAPTPVSALLHAGVVNLGGFVLIQLSPLIGASPPAQTLLVVVGSLSAAIAGLVMLTRITIKVRLAWSTCSQMGLMVMECGLGLYDLALLHLVAHGLYKANAFLTSGEVVRNSIEREIVTGSQHAVITAPFVAAALALPITALITLASAAVWHRVFDVPALPFISITILSCGLATLVWASFSGRRVDAMAIAMVFGAVQLYLGWHWLFSATLHISALPTSSLALAVWSCLIFVGLYFMQAWAVTATSTLSRSRLYDWIYAGLYLDELFTRLTFRLWPPNVASYSTELTNQNIARNRSPS